MRDAQRAAGRAYGANQDAIGRTVRVVKLVGQPLRYLTAVHHGLPMDIAQHQAAALPGQVDRVADWVAGHMQRWAKQELEGQAGEDRELELARRYTRFAHRALSNAWQAPRAMPSTRAAHGSIRHAARRDLPGLVAYLPQILDVTATQPGMTGAGSWHRQGDTIVVELD